METNKMLYYTDGHNVTVTDAGFKVKNTLYQLNGISRHGFSIVAPPRAPYAVLLIIGAVIFGCGVFDILPLNWHKQVTILGFSVIVNAVVMTAGSVIFGAGMLVMLRIREKYAVRIYTAEGEKNVVVSQSREYISQIIDALNRAFLDLMKTKSRK
ncbi:MAG TPA: DUF6232 family protein [Cyclobacteriaceae bacterium]|jgi:hypothetical protein|nr:DUF6232 family protein [Cyclobacteriaceae bacterium]